MPVIEPLILLLHRLRNAVDYPLRQAVRLRRAGLRFRNEPKTNLFAFLGEDEQRQAQSQEARLSAAYHLETIAANSSGENYRENLYYLELLERAFTEVGMQLPLMIRVADIGPSHWFYVRGLYSLLHWWQAPGGRDVELSGFEADAYRVYNDFRSRHDHALAHMSGLPGVRYLPRAFQAQPGAFDLALMLFPFVFVRDHLEWGLPGKLFLPEELLSAAWTSLRRGGRLVVVNQGEAEHRVQRALLDQVGIPIAAAFRHESCFYQYDLPRWVLVSGAAAGNPESSDGA
jgi:hypothetical protein